LLLLRVVAAAAVVAGGAAAAAAGVVFALVLAAIPLRTVVCLLQASRRTDTMCFCAALQCESAVQRIGVKERRASDRRPQWHVQPALEGLLRGETVPLPPEQTEKPSDNSARKAKVLGLPPSHLCLSRGSRLAERRFLSSLTHSHPSVSPPSPPHSLTLCPSSSSSSSSLTHTLSLLLLLLLLLSPSSLCHSHS
jgi:hypothetical protein